jgi:hypothetical protein
MTQNFEICLARIPIYEGRHFTNEENTGIL